MAEKEDKAMKRKRSTYGSSKPSKRIAIEGDNEIKVSVLDTGKWAPVIASTPGLVIPASVPLRPFTRARKNPPSGPGRKPISATELLLHSSAHHKLDYTAREEEAGGSSALLKHYVGVYDPETGKLEVMEARKLVVRGSVRAHQATIEDELSTNMRELRNNLGQTFGTKKAKKAIASFTENAISPEKSTRLLANGAKAPKLDAAARTMIARMAESTAGMATRDELAAVADAAKPRPTANLEAEDIKDVYTVDSLVGTSIMMHVPVRQWEKDLKAKKEIVTNSRFVSHRVAKVGDNVGKLKILRYILFALEILRISKHGRGVRILPRRDELKAALEDMPEAVLENFRRKYADAGQISKFKLDLLYTHLCALACLVDNFEVDIWDLKEDLRLETKDMSQYFKEIGARIMAFPEGERKKLGLEKAAAAQRKIAKLRLPLEFPKVSFGRARK